jgi:AcrR family transcriptional regulator
MTRPKTISDDELLAVARKVFRAKGNGAAVRDIALAANISEGVLYQRFGTKDAMFFAAMRPSPPDLGTILGPERPTEEARAYVNQVVARMTRYFSEILPLALRLMMHPAFTPKTLGELQHIPSQLHAGLARRLGWLVEQKRIRKSATEPVAQLLVSLAHDWALGRVMGRGGPATNAQLEAMVDVLWKGIAAPIHGAKTPER